MPLVTADGFELPAPPSGLVYPQTAQLVATWLAGAALLATVLYALWEWRRTRSPLMLVFLAGGAVCYLNEPIDDLLGLVWYPRPGQWVAFTTFGPVPWWGLFVYVVFFGAVPYLVVRSRSHWTVSGAQMAPRGVLVRPDTTTVSAPPRPCEPSIWITGSSSKHFSDEPLALRSMRRTGVTVRSTWTWFGAFFVLDALIACSAAVGWPIFSALNAQAPTPVKYAAALLTMALGVGLVAAIAALGVRASKPVTVTV